MTNDEVLELLDHAHVGNAAWREWERGRFLAKGKAAGHMDLIRAGSMATWELQQPGEDEGVSQYISLRDV